MVEEGYGVQEGEVEIERRRLGMLAEARDPRTRRMLDSTGLSPGWRCWELGAGGGTVSAWLGRRVGPDGSVWSTDVDLQFHRPVLPNVVVERHDVTRDQVPDAAFDLVHARAVLQHLPERDQVMETLWDALVPDGWLVVEDGAFASFAEQTPARALRHCPPLCVLRGNQRVARRRLRGAAARALPRSRGSRHRHHRRRVVHATRRGRW